MELESPLPYSNEPSRCVYPEPDESSPGTPSGFIFRVSDLNFVMHNTIDCLIGTLCLHCCPWAYVVSFNSWTAVIFLFYCLRKQNFVLFQLYVLTDLKEKLPYWPCNTNHMPTVKIRYVRPNASVSCFIHELWGAFRFVWRITAQTSATIATVTISGVFEGLSRWLITNISVLR
jgi:hypothetical protein